MDKIRKFFIVLGQSIEKIVLVIMVGILIYRVWMVLQGDQVGTETVGPGPKTPVDTASVPVVKPPDLPVLPPLPPVSALERSNPFWVYGRTLGASANTQTSAASETPAFTLKSVNQSSSGNKLARIGVGSGSAKAYKEGDTIPGGFVVSSIDVDAKTVSVENSEKGQSLVLTLEG